MYIGRELGFEAPRTFLREGGPISYEPRPSASFHPDHPASQPPPGSLARSRAVGELGFEAPRTFVFQALCFALCVCVCTVSEKTRLCQCG